MPCLLHGYPRLHETVCLRAHLTSTAWMECARPMYVPEFTYCLALGGMPSGTCHHV